jgi:hypothetical protein
MCKIFTSFLSAVLKGTAHKYNPLKEFIWEKQEIGSAFEYSYTIRV